MKQLIIRNVDESVQLKLKTRAAAKGRSLEAELRDIVTHAANEPIVPRNMVREMRELFLGVGGTEDLVIPPRVKDRDPPDFSK